MPCVFISCEFKKENADFCENIVIDEQNLKQ